MQRLSRLLALLFALAPAAAFGQAPDSPQYYMGRKLWYEPAHEKYAPVDFHRVPDFDKGAFHLERKTRFEVIAHGRGWLRLRIEQPYRAPAIAYLPMRMLRSRLYVPPSTGATPETFRRAAIFEEDPDLIRARLERAANPVGKPAAKERTWIRKLPSPEQTAPQGGAAPPVNTQ